MAQTYAVTRDITILPRTVAAPDGKPVRPEAADNQRLMAEILEDPTSWTPELAKFTTQVFDAMAENWADERGGYRAGRPFATCAPGARSSPDVVWRSVAARES